MPSLSQKNVTPSPAGATPPKSDDPSVLTAAAQGSAAPDGSLAAASGQESSAPAAGVTPDVPGSGASGDLSAPASGSASDSGATPPPSGSKPDSGGITVTGDYKVAQDLFDLIPHDSAEVYKIVPLARKENMLYIGTTNMSNLDARDALNFIATSQGLEYTMQEITEEQFGMILSQYGQDTTSMTDALEELEDQHDVVLGVEEEEADLSDSIIREEAPIIKLVGTILSQAVEKGASDIHIESLERQSIVRYRVDGVLQEQLRFARRIHESLVARIKIVSNLRLDERRRPQDGRFATKIRKGRVDFRVATFPTANGEKVILRVLDKQKGMRKIADLGFNEDMQEKVLRAVKRPYGLILATGPTGSGKTTTLYALLNTVDKKRENVVSLEDPVEYQMDGVNQSNVRPEIGYTFATGLRSVLRGDPDQILVGEIRDKETAQLAVQAALTGHLVYSTLHTNTAIGAISRLNNFGIDPFLLAPTLALVIGQRMMRRLDGDGKEIPVSAPLAKYLDGKFTDLPQKYRSTVPDFTAFKEAVPTGSNPSGMKGRVGAFEILEIDEEIRTLMLDNPSESAMYEAARKNGFLSMGEDAIVKGLSGLVPFSEVARISNEDALNELNPAFAPDELEGGEATPPPAGAVGATPAAGVPKTGGAVPPSGGGIA